MADVAEYEPRLKTKYREEIRARLKEKFGYANEMMIPRLDKVVINMGLILNLWWQGLQAIFGMQVVILFVFTLTWALMHVLGLL